ncbi:diphosphomevalonate decarboxylase [Levilactobacillus bambusae]|uniref:diphosphomevalonate decarboxylase n=1 Tax=Levilactobacillus bambusae TaxID=2024736 RepID=A0A2V1N0X6_9LACO|nr:diphosphomevalonate decarboxylase [Levilactobacillus bambusae]PWG00874.1 diphosphomevalonate decarboxylase [Levilactobacillus bambusae]
MTQLFSKSTARAHTNIALVKYWGKADSDLKLPITDSLSLTLDGFYTDTSVVFDDCLTADEVTLNSHRLSLDEASRVHQFLDVVREWSHLTTFARVQSVNHVPTSAGLASSASAFAALAGSASRAAGLNLSRKDLSRLARRGSGSASRSIYGGFVQWQKGNDETSYAFPVEEDVTWPISMVALIVDANQKKVSSTLGMQTSVASSPFYAQWPTIVAKDLEEIKPAILNHDLTHVGQIMEANAMRMHALTLSAAPSFTYFNGETIRAMNLVQSLRQTGVECYFTLDAGPNLKILCESENETTVVAALASEFGADHVLATRPGKGLTYLSD